MEEKQILRRDSKEPHTDVTVPTFSQLCRGREDRARREKEEEKERKETKIPEKRQRTQRENKLDKGAWQGGNRQRESKREKGKRERNEESRETKQRPRVACVLLKATLFKAASPASCLHRPPVKHSLSSTARFYWPLQALLDTHQ